MIGKMAAKKKRVLPSKEKSGNQYRSAAEARFTDAHVLLRERRYLAALYLGGYTVEMMLKWALADAAGNTTKAVEYTGSQGHDFTLLLASGNFKNRLLSDPSILRAWNVVQGWTTAWRYETELPADFRAHPERKVKCWLDQVEILTEWLILRT